MNTDSVIFRLFSTAGRLAAVIATTLLAVAVSIYSLNSGWFIVFQNFFYFPIIIACVYYLKRGFAFSVGLAFLYLFLILSYTSNIITIREAFIRVAVFIAVAGVVTYLSHLHTQAEKKLLKSEEQYRNLVEKSSDWMWMVDAEGRYTYGSSKVWDILGYRPEEIIGKTPFDFMPPEEAVHISARFRNYLVEHKPFSGLANINLHRDGRRVILETSGEPVFNASGAFAGYRGIDRDITEREEAEEKIRNISAVQNLILENSSLGIALVRNRTFEWVNARVGELLMLPLERIKGASTRVIYPSDEAYEELGNKAYPILATGKRSDNTIQLRRSDGSLFWCRFIGKALNPAKPQDGSIWMFEDITERKKAEERSNKEMALNNFLIDLYKKAAAMADKELFKYILDQVIYFTNSTVGFFHLISDDQKEVILSTWNNEALRDCTASYATHYPIEQAGNWVDCVRLQKPVIYNDFLASPNRKGLPAGHSPLRRFMSIPVLEENKVRIIFGVGNKPEEYTEDDAILIQVVANDLQRIIGRRRAEEALKQSELHSRSLIENSADIITIMDADGTIRYDSPTIKRILGYEHSELVGRSIFELVHPDDLPAVMDSFQKTIQNPDTITSFEYRFRYNDGSWRVLESVAQSMLENEVIKGIIINSRDITERKKIEAELQKKNLELAATYEELKNKQNMIIQQEKMASIGMLAAGIAHEIKNPLAILWQGIDYLQTIVANDELAAEIIARMDKAVFRADIIVKGLLSYARRNPLSFALQNIAELIDESLVLTEHELRKKNLQVIKQYSPDLAQVFVDGNQIKQVFVNLLVNGADAMSKGGTFTIITGPASDGIQKMIEISLKDTGHGIPADKIKTIFDPFYTTKDIGNTGLGLSISKGIIESHGGIIYAESQVGKGANFIIKLPVPS